MRRVAFIALGTLCGAAAFGQGLLDCIEPDVLRALLLQEFGERPLVFAATVPPELSMVRMPAQFTFIGSRELGPAQPDATATQVTAAWRSSLPQDATRTATVNALAASGWHVEQTSAGARVFTSASVPDAQTACREGRRLTFILGRMEGATYVLITPSRAGNLVASCGQASALPRINTGVEPYLPHLELPADPATGEAARMQGGGQGSSSGTVNARAEFISKVSAGNAAGHFAKQLAGQGWTNDAAWSGATTAGSSWSRREAGGLIHGMLSVFALSDNVLRAELRISRLQ